jgi:hypothetical protein
VVLGIEPTTDASEVRRAYARKLKVTQPEDDPEGFQQLRRAYEFARNHCIYAQNEESAESVDEEPAQDPPRIPLPGAAPPVRPAPVSRDPARSALEAEFDRLSAILGSSRVLDADAAATSLRALLTSDHLHRVDLNLEFEGRIADLLLNHAPRSDSLLRSAIDRFRWDLLENEEMRPPAAEPLVKHERTLHYWEQLPYGDNEFGEAFRRLANPSARLRRFCRGYVLHHWRWPELELLNRIDAERPDLLAKLDPENVAWWRRFVERPRLTAFTVGVLVVPSFLILAWLTGRARRADPPGSGWPIAAAVVGGLLLICLYRLYVLDWPALLAQRRWNGSPPARFAVGWLPGVIALLLLGLLFREVAWAGWIVFGLTCIAGTWAAIASGPSPPFVLLDKLLWWNSRLARIVGFNLAVGMWLTISIGNDDLVLGTTLLLTMLAALAASAVCRDGLMKWFESTLTLSERKTAGAFIVVGALATIPLMFMMSARPSGRARLAVAVVVLVMLRRAFRFERPNLSEMRIPPGFYWIGVIVLFNGVRYMGGARSLAPANSVIDWFIAGGVAILTGVLIGLGHWFSRARDPAES